MQSRPVQSVWRTRLQGLLCLVLLGSTGCSDRPDPRQVFDSEVNQHYLKNFNQLDAIEFLRKGGRYGDLVQPDLDRQHVLPLLEGLEQKFQVRPIAIFHPTAPDRALAIVVGATQDASSRQLRAHLEQVQKTFPVDILLQPGKEWIGLDFQLPAQPLAPGR